MLITNDATMGMKKLMKNQAIRATGASPLFRHFTTTKDLINTYSSCTGIIGSIVSSFDCEESDETDEKQTEE